MKILFWPNLGRYFHIWGQIEAVFHIWKFSKWPPFWAPDKLFLPEVIPEGEFTRKIAMSISDILSIWSTLLFKYWLRYINFKIWLILWPGDVIIEVVNIHLYNCNYNLILHMHRKFNDDIFARRLVIMNIEGRLWGHPVTSSMTSSSWKYFFCIIWDDIFHIWGQIEAVFHISKFS